MKSRNILTVIAFALALVLVGLVLFVIWNENRRSPQPVEPATQTAVPTTQMTVPTTVPTTASATQPLETTAPPETEPVKPEGLMAMGTLYITTGGWVSEDYSDATVRAEAEFGSVEEQPAQIRIRGYSSTWAKKKAYNIKFTEKVDLFGMGAGKKWCLIANAYDKTLLRNSIGLELAEKLRLDFVSSTQLCKVYMDGVYLGVYTAMEPVDEGKNRVDIDLSAGDFLLERSRLREEAGVTYITTNGGLRFEMRDPETPDAVQLAAITELVNQAEAAVQTRDHKVYRGYIDVASFVDYYIFHELIKDIDFAQYSTRYYMKDGVLYAGPPWDLDLTMGNVSKKSGEWKYWNYHNQDESTDQSGDSTRAFWAQKDFYMWLCQDPWFQNAVRERWKELHPVIDNLAVDNELGQNRLDVYVQTYQADLETNFTEAGWSLGWPAGRLENQSPSKTYAGNVEILRDWLQRRIAWLDSQWLETG